MQEIIYQVQFSPKLLRLALPSGINYHHLKNHGRALGQLHMQTAEAKLKRIMIVRLEEGERLPDCLESLARRKKIRSALVLLLGGARAGKFVVGPVRRKKPSILTASFRSGHEIMGIGTIFTGNKGPELHLHAAAGRGSKTLMGCGRTGFKVNFIIEVVIFELAGLKARRALDPLTGFHLLTLAK